MRHQARRHLWTVMLAGVLLYEGPWCTAVGAGGGHPSDTMVQDHPQEIFLN